MDIQSKILKTENVDWQNLSWLQGDVKKISQDHFNRLIESLRRNGFIAPFHVWADKGTIWILDGHHRKRAMEQLQKEGANIPKTLPANFISCNNKKEARALVLVYSSIYARIGEEQLYKYLNENELDFNLLKTQIEIPEINLRRFESEYMADEILEDEVPEPPVAPVTRAGDFYEFGSHRLLCGDSGNIELVAKLMGDSKAVLFATDPPYGIDYSNAGTNSSSLKGIWDDIKFDDLRDSKLQDFLIRCFSAWLPHLENNAAWYLWHAHLTQGFFSAAAAAAADVILHRQIIWVKPQLIMGMGMFHWKHEPCFMGWRKGHRPPWYWDRTQTTVWEIGYLEGRNKGEGKEHPTQKPVELFARPIKFHTKEKEIVAEPFAGSGAQFLAAEQLGRRCFGMEIEPKYCDVIIQRYVNLTGNEQIRLNGLDVKWGEKSASP